MTQNEEHLFTIFYEGLLCMIRYTCSTTVKEKYFFISSGCGSCLHCQSYQGVQWSWPDRNLPESESALPCLPLM